MKRSTKTGKPKFPRVPLPRQVGGAHEDRRKRPARKRKHKGREEG